MLYLYKIFKGGSGMDKKRLRQLYTLISRSDGWLSARELAARLHTSTRTVRNYIREINREKPYILSSQYGYQMNRYLPASGLEPRIFPEKPAPERPSDRIFYIIRRFIVCQELTMEQLMAELYISDRTLEQDLNAIRQLLPAFQLKLKTKKDRIFLSGPMYEQRRLAYYCIFQTMDIQYPTLEFICGAFPEYDCARAADILDRTIDTYGLSVNGYEHYDLLLYVIIQLREIHLGHELTGPECPVECIQNYPEYPVAGHLAKELGSLIGHSYTIWEQEYLAALLISKTYWSDPGKACLLPNYVPIRNTVAEFIRMAGAALQISLEDPELLEKLACYFQRLLVRQQMGFYTKSLFFDALKYRYPIIQDVCAWCLLHFSRQFHISVDRNEVGFLTMLLCEYVKEKGYPFEQPVPCTLICPSFGRFPETLLNTLQERLGPSIHIDTVIDTLDVETITSRDRLTLSVIPVANRPFILPVSPYPRSTDFRHIYEEIHKIKMRRYCRSLHAFLSRMMTPETFFADFPFTSREDLLGRVCARLKDMGFVTDGFEGDLLRREAIDSSAFGDTVAIPHHCSEKIRKAFACVILNKDAMYWHDGYTHLVVILATPDQETPRLQKIYNLAVKVFASRKNTETLLSAATSEAFLDALDQLGQTCS